MTVVISRLNRAGVDVVASSHASLQFGDILNLVGRPEAIDAVAAELERTASTAGSDAAGVYRHCRRVLLGSVPLFISRLPVALKLGLAGGPLIMAGSDLGESAVSGAHSLLVYAAERQPRSVSWGLMLFLAVVGLKRSAVILSITLTAGDGLAG